MLNALPPVPPASKARVAIAARNVAQGLTPQGHKLDAAELLSQAWECSLDDAEAFVARYGDSPTLATALADARGKLASKPLD